MSATEFDDISNKAIAAHLGRQDGAMVDLAVQVRDLAVQVRTLHELLQDSVTDRRELHRQIDDINTERARLLREGAVLRQGFEERLAAVEGRGDLADIRAALAELLAANALQLRLHRWLTVNRIKARFVVGCGLVSVAAFSQVIGAIFHHLGWS